MALVFGSLDITRAESVPTASISLYLLDQTMMLYPSEKILWKQLLQGIPIVHSKYYSGKFFHHQISVSPAAISTLFLGSTSGPIELFDALRLSQAPSPDAAFAINMSKEFLADSAQNDNTFSPEARPLEGMKSQLLLPDPTLPCPLWGRQRVWSALTI